MSSDKRQLSRWSVPGILMVLGSLAVLDAPPSGLAAGQAPGTPATATSSLSVSLTPVTGAPTSGALGTGLAAPSPTSNTPSNPTAVLGTPTAGALPAIVPHFATPTSGALATMPPAGPVTPEGIVARRALALEDALEAELNSAQNDCSFMSPCPVARTSHGWNWDIGGPGILQDYSADED